jgi:hypothetical protein
MNAIVTTIIAALGWSASPVSAPYGFVDVGHLAVTSGNSTVEISEVAPYAPYSLTCQHSFTDLPTQRTDRNSLVSRWRHPADYD